MSNDPIKMAIDKVRRGFIVRDSIPDSDFDQYADALDMIIEVALRQHQQDGGWLPIETAPKDGTEVLVWNVNRSWQAKFKPEDEVENSWWIVTDSLRVLYEPTHWQPLPAPPHTETERG